jgi:hypothetical protein
MVLRTKSMTRRVVAGGCVVVFAFLLAACSISNSNSSANSGNASQASNGNPNSFKSSTTATPTAHSSTPVVMKTYNGNGFGINYPQNWKETKSGSEVSFTDPTNSYNLTIGSATNSDGTVTADHQANSTVTKAKTNLKNVGTVNVPQTITLANQTWSQRSLTGTGTSQGQSTPIQMDILATNHPGHASNTKGYVIVYVAVKDKFSQGKGIYFTPMLQSFRFTS